MAKTEYIARYRAIRGARRAYCDDCKSLGGWDESWCDHCAFESAMDFIRSFPAEDVVPRSVIEEIFEAIENDSNLLDFTCDWDGKGEWHFNEDAFRELKKKYGVM